MGGGIYRSVYYLSGVAVGEKEETMKRLNLGCADTILPGFDNVDIGPPADTIADLSLPWPWETSSVEYVMAHDIIEHLPNKIHTMNEMYRVLIPNGQVDIIVPTIRGVGSVCDPTHKSYWSAGDFEYYEKGNFARERFRNSYGIAADFRIVSHEHSRYQNKFGEEVWKFGIILEAVK